MQTVGSYEAKTRLPELLRFVEKEESITITRRGAPVARLVGIDDDARDDTSTGTVIARMRRARARRQSVSVMEILSARDQGAPTLMPFVLDASVTASWCFEKVEFDVPMGEFSKHHRSNLSCHGNVRKQND